MAYTPQTINSGDAIESSWGNKIEQELAKIGNYMGEVATKDDLPTSPDEGDFYLVKDKAAFYYWNGTKWRAMSGDTLLAANEDTFTTTYSAWTGLKGFTLLNGENPFQELKVKTVAYVSPSGATGNLRVVVFDYNGDNALVTGSASSVTNTDPILIELEPLDISTLTPSAAYTVSLQGNVSGGAVSIVATEFYGG